MSKALRPQAVQVREQSAEAARRAAAVREHLAEAAALEASGEVWAAAGCFRKALALEPSAALALVAGAWFLLRRTGWVLASVSQALCLGSCLLLYSASAPGYIYPVMAYSVLTVMYLNSRDVRTILHAPRKSWTGRAGAGP